MEPIHDRSGAVVGWIHNGRVLDRRNQYRGFLSGDAVYSMKGRYLGRYTKGFFRDNKGNAVAFTAGSSGGPLTPLAQLAPIPPLPPLAPMHPLPPLAPLAPLESLSWGVEWHDFLGA